MSIEIFKPGLGYYVERIESGKPFAFVRYGEGDLQVASPDLPVRRWIERHWSGWTTPGVRKVLRRTLSECCVSDDYLVALWHLEYFVAKQQIAKLERWLKTCPVSTWHDGGVFKDAVIEGTFGSVVRAMRELPVVLVGPARLEVLQEKSGLKHFRHVVVHHHHAFLDWRKTAKIMAKQAPAFFALSAGVASKVLIHHLWPRVDNCSFVDFGAVLDGLCGYTSRPYHHDLTREQIERNLGG